MDSNIPIYLALFFFLSFTCCTKHQLMDIDTNKLVYQTAESMGEFDYGKELTEIAATSRIIGFGEANHGTLEFEQIKFNIVKDLVVNKGYRNVIMEVGVPQGNAVNGFVHGQELDIKRLMAMYFPWPYATTTVLNLIEWLREYNRSNPDSVQVNFYGMDMQGYNALKAMRYELSKTGKISGIKDTALVVKLEGINGTEKERRMLLKMLLDEYAHKKYEETMDSIITRNMIESQMNINIKHGGRRFADRERMMFDNASFIIKNGIKNNKFVIWSHNDHVSKKYNGRESLGNKLYTQFGWSYKAIGFEFNHGNFRAYDLASTQSDSVRIKTFIVYSNKHTLGYQISSINKGILGMSLLSKKTTFKNCKINSIGATYSYTSAMHKKSLYIESITLEKSFDYFFIVNSIHPTTSIYLK